MLINLQGVDELLNNNSKITHSFRETRKELLLAHSKNKKNFASICLNLPRTGIFILSSVQKKAKQSLSHRKSVIL